MEKSITIDIENSNRDDDVTVITNLSSVEASYTVVQGTEILHKDFTRFVWVRIMAEDKYNQVGQMFT